MILTKRRYCGRPHVRRKTLLAVRALATHDPSIMQWLSKDVSERLRDPDPAVVGIAIAICSTLSSVRMLSVKRSLF